MRDTFGIEARTLTTEEIKREIDIHNKTLQGECSPGNIYVRIGDLKRELHFRGADRKTADYSIECQKCKKEISSRAETLESSMRMHKELTGHSLFRVVIYNEELPLHEI